MNRHITIAALLFAGTVFAGAEETPTKTADLVFSDTSWSGGKQVSVTNAAETFGAENLVSWNLSFTFEGNEYANKWGSSILATGDNAYASNYSSGFQIRWNNGTESGHDDGKIYFMWGNENSSGMSFDQLSTVVAENVSFDSARVLNFSLDYVYATKTLTVSVSDDDGTVLGTGEKLLSTGYEKNSFSSLTNIKGGTEPVNAPDSWNYSNLKGSVTSAIPEPSAFGLLAGAGALALVAARRRRK